MKLYLNIKKKVSEGSSGKFTDQVSDSILYLILKQDETERRQAELHEC